ncbi:hypothetical protein M885DRAFT_531139 [Pelagophyceae sp. CCMP2097]|nr:hypothetical protein M885DRAFT_531139 [Pelagophyceae sp. CCMP2097]
MGLFGRQVATEAPAPEAAASGGPGVSAELAEKSAKKRGAAKSADAAAEAKTSGPGAAEAKTSCPGAAEAKGGAAAPAVWAKGDEPKAKSKAAPKLRPNASFVEEHSMPDDLKAWLFAEDVGMKAFPYDPPNVVRVVVLRAKGLKVMDRDFFGSGGSSDPLVKLRIDSAYAATTPKRKQVNPVWDEKFELEASLATSNLELVVEDYDLIGSNDFMGKCAVPLEGLKDRKVHRAFYALSAQDGAAADGELEVAARFFYDAAHALLLPADVLAADAEPKKAPNEVHVFVLRCKNLPVLDPNLLSKGGSSDPFVALELQGERRTTAVKKKDLHPLFMEHFALPAEDADLVLAVDVFDHDLVSNAFIGACAVPLRGLVDRKLHRKWYALRPRGDAGAAGAANLGAVELGIRWRHSARLALDVPAELLALDDAASQAPNELVVAVLRAVDLPAMDRHLLAAGGTSDPVVSLRLDGSTVKTTVKKKTLNPVWQEVLRFQCDDEDAQLVISVDDWDLVGSNDLLGRVAPVPIRAFADRRVARAWYALTEALAKGTVGCAPRVELAVRWWHNPALALVLPAAMHVAEDAESAALPPNALLVHLVRGKRLRAMDRNLLSAGGSSDPLVLFDLDGETASSTTKMKTLKPVWLEQFEFVADDTAGMAGDYAQVLKVSVEDYDLISGNDFMGEFDIPLRLLADRALRRSWYPLKGAVSGGGSDLGSIEIAARWVHDPRRVLALPAAVAETEAAADRAHAPNELVVALLRARGLVVMDANLFSRGGSSDSVATLALDGEAQTSSIKRKSLTPKWSECFSFTMEEEAKFVLTLEDHDDASRNDFMGQVTIDFAAQESTALLEDLRARAAPVRSWYELRDGAGAARPPGAATRGRVELALRWRYNAARATPLPAVFLEAEASPDRDPNALRVVLIRARHLPIKDKHVFSKGGSSDPFATLRVGADEVRSTSKKKQLRPVWCESFELACEDVEESLVVSIADRDVLRSEFMGDVAVTIVSLADRRVTRRWFALKGAAPKAGGAAPAAGEVELAMRWVFNADLVFAIPGDMEARETHGGMPANQLRICLVRARNLVVSDRHVLTKGGSSDPYVTFSLRSARPQRGGGGALKSGVQAKKLAPVWLERFDAALDDVDSATLLCTVYDYDALSRDDFMGACAVPLKALRNRQPKRAWHALLGERGAADVPRGAVELVLRFVHDPAVKGAFYDAESPGDRAAISNACRAAVEGGDDAALRVLLARGARCGHVLMDAESRRTPLHAVAERAGDVAATCALLRSLKVDVDQADAGRATPLHAAARADRPQAIGALLRLGAEAEAEDDYGYRPAHAAAAAGSDAALQALVVRSSAARPSMRPYRVRPRRGRRVGRRAFGCRPHRGVPAGCRGEASPRAPFQRFKVDLNAQTHNGKTPAGVAAQSGYSRTLRVLQQLGAAMDQPGDEFGGRTPLHLAAAAGHSQCVEVLVELGCDVDSRDAQGWTAAHHAFSQGRASVVAALRRCGADFTLEDNDFRVAATYQDGADPDNSTQRDDDSSATTWAQVHR